MFQRILGKKAKHGTAPPVEPQPGGPEQNQAILKSVPKDTLGLHVLYEPKTGEPVVDIVAVHGLGGNSFSTWKHPNGTLWLRDLLPLELDNARIMTYGYDSGLFTKARTERSFTFAEGLLSELRDLRSGPAKNRPLFFIAHSLGGIVVKKVLIIAKSRHTQYGDIYDSTRHLMFFGTPHQGTDSTAGFLRRLGASMSAESSVLRELELWSPQVLETNSFFLTEIAPRFTITTFWERQRVGGVQVVDEGSARLNQTHEDVIGLDADHRTMCKFADASDNKFVKTVRRLQAETASLADQTLNVNDVRITDLLKTAELGSYLKSLNTAQFQLEGERWINQEYSRALVSELRSWIGPPPFDDNDFLKHYSKISTASETSGEWIFQQDAYKKWESGEVNLLWLGGRPGSGKSVLASKVVYRLREKPPNIGLRPLILHAFCDKQNKDKSSSSALLATILWQIVASNPLLVTQRLEILTDCRRTVSGSNAHTNALRDHRFAYLSSLFRKYMTFLPMVIVVDGLDECHDSEQLALLLNEPEIHQCKTLRIWVSSQKVRAIAQQLSRASAVIDMEENSVRQCMDREIHAYVRGQLLLDRNSLGSIDSVDVDAMAKSLTTKANGMFLWAAFTVAELLVRMSATCYDSESLFRSIDALPEKMEDVVLYLLSRIFEPLDGRANEQRRARLLQSLQWCFYAVRPLKVVELQAAINIPIDVSSNHPARDGSRTWDVPELLQLLYPLVYVSEQTVHLMHSTVKHYVLQASQKEALVHEVQQLHSRNCHSEIAAQCLSYLSMPGLEDFVLVSSQTDTSENLPLFQYAAAQWTTHAISEGTIDEPLRDQIHRFLSSKQAITWLESYISSGVGDLKALESSLYQTQGSSLLPRWLLQILVDCVEERQERDPESRPTTLLTNELGHLHRYHGNSKEAARLYEWFYNKQKAAVPKDQELLFHAMNNLSLAKSDLNQMQESKSLLDELLAMTTESAGAQPDEKVMITLGNLATVYSRLGQSTKALELSLQRLTLCREIRGERHEHTCVAYNNAAYAHLEVGDCKTAKVIATTALELFTELNGQNSAGALFAMGNLASAESALGNNAEAFRICKHVWQQRKTAHGEEHPDTLIACNNYCSALGSLDRTEEAVPLLQQQLRICQKLHGPSHPRTLTSKGNLAEAFQRIGKYAESLEMERDILATKRSILGDSHPDTLLTMSNYGSSLLAVRQLSEAGKLLAECLKLRYLTAGARRMQFVTSLRILGIFYQTMCAYHYAEYIAHRTIKLTREDHPADHPSSLRNDRLLAGTLRDIGQYDTAEIMLKRVLRLARRASVKEADIVLAAKIDLASVFRLRGEYEAGYDLAGEVLDEQQSEQSMGAQSPGIWQLAAVEQQGLALGELNRHHEALEKLKIVYEERTKTFGAESNAILQSQLNLAVCYLDLGRVDTAQLLVSPLLERWPDLMGPRHLLTARAMSLQAKCWSRMGRFAEAKPMQSRVIKIDTDALGPKHLLTLRARFNYARMSLDAGEYVGPEGEIIDLLKDQQRFLRDGHPHTVETEKCLETICAHMGKLNQRVPVREYSEDMEKPTELEKLSRAYNEALQFMENDHPEILVLRRDLALAHEQCGRKDEATRMLQEILACQNDTLTPTHAESLMTLLELTRVADQVTDDQQLLLSNGLMAMIRDKSPKDLTCFRKLVARCSDIAIKDPETSYGPLALAVHNDEVELARCLLEVGADANRVEDNGKTALHIAVEVRSTELLSLLLKYGAKPDVVNTVDGGSPLRLACAKGQLEAARMLLDASADPNFDENLLPLHSAAGFDRTTVVELLLDRGADIEKSSPDGLTPFLHCVSFGHLETTILLHKRGANTRASTPRGIIALPLACVKGYPAIVKFLLSIGHDASDPGSADGSRPLHLAAEVGHWEIMEILIEAGASLDDKTLNASAQTPLVSAVFGGRADIVRRILEIPGQTANRTHGSMDAQPLHVAAFAGHVDVIKELLAGGAEIDAMTTNGMTAMQIAVAKQHLEAADALRASGASLEDVELDDNLLRGCNAQKKYNLLEAIIKHPSTEIPGHVFGGLTWLYVAIYVLPISTMRALLDRGVDPNVAPIIGPGRRQYPLQFAAELNQPEHVQVLLDYGADQSLEDHLGRTAVDLVQQGDDAFSMLSSTFRTPKERLVANVKAFVKGLCDEVLDALGNGSSKTAEAVRDRSESIAVTLLCVPDFHDSARIALEQCISWKETEEGGRVIVHTLDCNVCRALKGIEGVMYVCQESDGLVLCAECFGRYKGLDAGKGDEEGAGKVCRHGAERFFRVPEEEGWEEMDEKGFVCWAGGENEGERMGVSLEEWLVSLASI